MSFSELQQELNDWTFVVNSDDVWFFPSLVAGGKPTPDGRQEGIPRYIDALKKENLVHNQDDIDRKIDEAHRFSDHIKQQMRDTFIPQLEELIRNHPDNPNHPLNPYDPNIDPSNTPIAEYINTGGCNPFIDQVDTNSYDIDKGQLTVRCTYYGSSGNFRLSTETQYVNKKKHGLFRSYYNTGDLSVKGDYWDGKKVGVWKHIYRPGTYENIEAYCIEYGENEKVIRRIPSC